MYFPGSDNVGGKDGGDNCDRTLSAGGMTLSGPLPSQYYTWGYYPKRPLTKAQLESHVGALRQENGVRHGAQDQRFPPKQSQYCQHLT
jgi:hypothetical protein